MRFKVNGKSVEVDVEADMPLLWVLRDELNIKGPKYGCGIAQCGACTVHMDGVAIRACQMPAEALEGSEIVTIEGLGDSAGAGQGTGQGAGGLHAVQQAWIAHQVAQCGYCQAGQIMQAAQLLADYPDPTDADIDAGMGGNLCRCGTYPRIRAAIKSAARNLREA